MNPIDAIWHILNFFFPAFGTGIVTAALAKLLWRRELKSASWLRLASAAVTACAVVSVAGLIAFGHDGKIVTYVVMSCVCALTLWLVGFGLRGR